MSFPIPYPISTKLKKLTDETKHGLHVLLNKTKNKEKTFEEEEEESKDRKKGRMKKLQVGVMNNVSETVDEDRWDMQPNSKTIFTCISRH